MKRLMTLALVSAASTAVMAEGITWSGDLKYRYEKNDQKVDATKYEKYNQERFSLRLSAMASPVESVKIEARLATGTGATSTNQTTGVAASAGQNYSFLLDRANLAYEMAEKLVLSAGRMGVKYQTSGSDLLWDNDVNIDGLHLAYKYGMGDVELTASAGSFQVVQTDTLNGKEATLQAYQLAAKGAFGETGYNIASGVNNFVGLDKVAAGTNNTNAGVGFKVWDTNLEVKLPFSMPVTIFADYAKNIAGKTDSKGTASLFGVKLNKLVLGWLHLTTEKLKNTLQLDFMPMVSLSSQEKLMEKVLV
jgi:Putative porin